MNPRDELSTPTNDAPPPDLAARLIQGAARRSPTELAERLEEEWLADLAERPGTLQRLRFALGCCWARQVIAHDPAAFGVTAARLVTGHGAITAFATPEVSYFSRRTVMLLLIIALHIVAIYGFSNGIAIRLLKGLPVITTAVFLPEPKPVDPTVRKTSSEFKGVFSRDRELADNIPVPFTPLDFTDEPPPPLHFTDNTPTTPRHTVTRIAGGPGAGFPATADFYPPVSRQLGERGVATVTVCVDARGRLTRAPEIRDSSGVARLDAGALALARAGSGYYRSTTEDGQPVDSCYAFRVRFDIR